MLAEPNGGEVACPDGPADRRLVTCGQTGGRPRCEERPPTRDGRHRPTTTDLHCCDYTRLLGRVCMAARRLASGRLCSAGATASSSCVPPPARGRGRGEAREDPGEGRRAPGGRDRGRCDGTRGWSAVAWDSCGGEVDGGRRDRGDRPGQGAAREGVATPTELIHSGHCRGVDGLRCSPSSAHERIDTHLVEHSDGIGLAPVLCDKACFDAVDIDAV